jgi:hypothetical protein
VLTLVIVPVLYWLIEGRSERKALKRKTKGKARPKAKLRKRLALKR